MAVCQRGYVATSQANKFGGVAGVCRKALHKGVAGFLSHIDEGYAGSLLGESLREGRADCRLRRR